MNIGNSSHIRESTVQLVQRRIAAMIRNGDLVPGQKLPSQRGFSEQLQVSRATLREGLMRLETLGLLRSKGRSQGRKTALAVFRTIYGKRRVSGTLCVGK